MGGHPEIAVHIDSEVITNYTHLSHWKQDKTSVYYRILCRGYGNIGTHEGPPLTMILGIVALIAGITLFLLIWNRLLKHQINQHTKDLKKSEEKYRTLSQKALVGIYQITRDGQLILANQRMADIFGYSSSQELLETTQHISTLFADPDQVNPLLREIDMTGAVQGKLVEFISKESRQIWGNLYIRRTSTDEGHPIYEGFMEDVSERYHHDQVLRASENRYRRFVETAIEGIWALDTNFCITFVNAMLAKMLGYTQEEMIGKKAEAFIFPQDLDTHQARVKNCTKGSHQQHESRFRKKDGSEYWAIVSASAIHTEDDEFDGAFAMFTDITDRKAAEEELKQAQKRFLAILNGIESTIYVADMETHEILFMNDYMKQLFGEDHTGGICWKAFRNQDKPCDYCTNRFLVTPECVPTGIHLWEDKHPVTGRGHICPDRPTKWVDGRLARL